MNQVHPEADPVATATRYQEKKKKSQDVQAQVQQRRATTALVWTGHGRQSSRPENADRGDADKLKVFFYLILFSSGLLKNGVHFRTRIVFQIIPLTLKIARSWVVDDS